MCPMCWLEDVCPQSCPPVHHRTRFPGRGDSAVPGSLCVSSDGCAVTLQCTLMSGPMAVPFAIVASFLSEWSKPCRLCWQRLVSSLRPSGSGGTSSARLLGSAPDLAAPHRRLVLGNLKGAHLPDTGTSHSRPGFCRGGVWKLPFGARPKCSFFLTTAHRRLRSFLKDPLELE
jgi:hypothetical protein